MLNSYSDSVAPGTLANRLTQAKLYLRFSLYYQVPALNPSSTDLCMYVQFLKNSFPAPTTIKNYLSGAKTWLAEHGGNLSAFSSFKLHQLSTGLTKRSNYVPRRAAPLMYDHIRIIADFCDRAQSVPLSAKACILIGFNTFLRSGNLLSPTMSTWGGPHTLSARDFELSDAGLSVTVHSTKTKTSSSPVTTIIPWEEDPTMCAPAAWHRYISTIRPPVLGPAFLTDNGLPLTPTVLVGIMRLALRKYKDLDPARVSMHSLRRGAAQSALTHGVPLNSIKERGMWRSDSGLAPYLA